jgi:hypothetical protein
MMAFITLPAYWQRSKNKGERTYLVLWDGYVEDDSPLGEPPQNIKDETLLDAWGERRMQELCGMVPAFGVVKFGERQG